MSKATAKIIQQIKYLYDTEGADACGRLFQLMLKERSTPTFAGIVFLLMKVVDKIDTCESDCFEDLENKKAFSCNCGGNNFFIPFEMDMNVGVA